MDSSDLDQDSRELESLETPDNSNGLAAGNSPDETSAPASEASLPTTPVISEPTPPPPEKPKGPGRFKRFLRHFNVYLLLFVLLLLIAGAVVVASYLYSKKDDKTASQINSQSLSQSTLEKLASSDATVGDPKSVLNVRSNAVFAGKVLVRDSLEVAGGLHVGGGLSLQGLSVSGDSQFQQLEVKNNLSVGGSLAVQGGLSVQSGLSVNGGGTFRGPVSAPQITASSLQLNGGLVLTHHLTAGGPIPSSYRGNAVGGGGSASLSGSDTAGSIAIGTGGSPSAGCFITVNFAEHFNATPHVIVTPVGSAAGGLKYYVNRSSVSFSVCTASPAPAGRSFGFDYIVFD